MKIINTTEQLKDALNEIILAAFRGGLDENSLQGGLVMAQSRATDAEIALANYRKKNTKGEK